MLQNPVAFIGQRVLGSTQGSLLFIDSNGAWTQNNARLNWNNTLFQLNVQGQVTSIGTVAGQYRAFWMQNTSNSSAAHSIFLFGNDTANFSGFFFNSSTRTGDGGTNTMTFFNDAGAVRFRANGQLRFATGAGAGAADRVVITGNDIDFSASATQKFTYTASSGLVSAMGGFSASTTIDGKLTALTGRNLSSGTNAHTQLSLINDTGTGFGMFINSSTRTADGGANTASFFNDAGDLRYRGVGRISFATGANPGTDRVYIEPTLINLDVAGGANSTFYINTTNGRVGIGTNAPTDAWLHIAANTTTKAHIKLITGTLLTTPIAGAIEYVSPILYITDGGAKRQTLVQSAFGSLYENTEAGTSLTITTANTYYGWISASADGYKYMTLDTSNATADRMTVDAGGDGDYFISFNASFFTANNNVLTHFAVFKNGTITNNVIGEHLCTNANVEQQISGSGILTGLVANDYLDLRITADNNGEVITLKHVSLTAVRINRT